MTEPATFCMLVSTMPRSPKAGIATQRSTPAYMRCTQRMRGPAAMTSGTHSPMITSASAASRTAACAIWGGDDRDARGGLLHPGDARRVRAHQHDLAGTRPARPVAQRDRGLAQAQFFDEAGGCVAFLRRARRDRREQA